MTQSAEPGEQFSAPEQRRSCSQLARSNSPTDSFPQEGCPAPQHPYGATDVPQDLQQPQNFLLQLAARQLPEDACRAAGTCMLRSALLVPALGPRFPGGVALVAFRRCLWGDRASLHSSPLLLALKLLQLAPS